MPRMIGSDGPRRGAPLAGVSTGGGAGGGTAAPAGGAGGTGTAGGAVSRWRGRRHRGGGRRPRVDRATFELLPARRPGRHRGGRRGGVRDGRPQSRRAPPGDRLACSHQQLAAGREAIVLDFAIATAITASSPFGSAGSAFDSVAEAGRGGRA